MEPEFQHSHAVSVASPSNSHSFEAQSSSSSQLHQEEEEEEERIQPQDEDQLHNHHHRQGQIRQSPSVSYRLSISITNLVPMDIRDDLWSCLLVLVTFCFFVSMTVIFGFFGSENVWLGPNCSRLIQVNPYFVQSIKVKEIDESKHGAMLFAFYEPPPLDVEVTWSEMHKTVIQSSFHKEWQYFLNKGSKVDISYSVKSPNSAPLSLVIAEGRENLVGWIEDPSYPNTTLSWNIIHGTGIIHQEISWPKTYYIAVGNLNSEEVEVQLNFTIKGLHYNTTQSYYSCSPSHQSCSLKLFILKSNVAVVTSPGPEQGAPYADGFIKLSYVPRWFTYLVGSGSMTLLILLAFRICNVFQIISSDRRAFQAGEMGFERAPLLSYKDDDLSSWGSSYDSLSHDEDQLDEWLSVDAKLLKDGGSNSSSRCLCISCFDAPRDCFFLPCGHCAACFTCGTRIVEETGTCPVCCRAMKKVRKIFTV
ncbi:E3 ubiquitin-protein ligase APD2-like [Cornus florida]|uniref:E3 ubiquitin-protein ligase APD2-like n=1 Tax=Cornus florida TaxID=4283 RepID=UPI0028967D02|nr:E3 ubiquitin-protein ligase APD2-like [Cornus florida]